MGQHEDTLPDHSVVLQMLQSLIGTELSPEAVAALANDIRPYLRRSRRPLDEALPRIADHYQRDGIRVRELLARREGPAWQAVLSHVVAYARSRSLFPQDQDATGWPDLDAYDDIRERLHEYNFEGPLDAWMSVVISSRLRRYWRDRQALSAGGGGFKSASERDTARAAGFPVARILHLSLDQPLGDDDRAVSEWLTHATPLVAETVEDAELSRIVAAEVKALASRGDPLLAEIWNAVVDRQMRLREAAECYGLTISQTHRRVERVRTHLKHSPQVRQWLERGG